MGNNVLKISSVDKGKGFSKISFKILFLTMVIVSLFACFSLANVAPKPNFKVSLVNASGALKPIASFTYSPSSPLAGQNTTFDGSGSSDPLGIITSYDWTFGDGGTGSGKIVTHQHADKGQYNVALTITDILSNTDTKHSIISAHGKPPIAQFTASQTTVDTGISIQFDASSSHDPDGTITGYQWTFGDGATATGVTTSHSYTTAGSYTVQLTVTDNDGSTNSCQNTITIHDRPPIAQFSASSRTVYTNVNIQFDASASYDPDGTITTYSWNFGDGNTAIGVTTSHSYYSASVYTVTLTVTDNYGSTGSSQTTITVQNRPQNQPPTARFTASNTTVETGSTVSLDASGSHDSDGTITNYQWNFGDGATSSGITTSHAYIENGTYTITLTVTDNGGLTNSIQTTITVEDRKPIAAFTTSADTVTTEVPVEFNASNSFDPDGTIVSFQWNFGDGNTTDQQTTQLLSSQF
jgi:PKD repeat protein